MRWWQDPAGCGSTLASVMETLLVLILIAAASAIAAGAGWMVYRLAERPS